MTPSARLNAAIEILQGLQGTNQPTDRFLKAWFASRRYAGSKDRAAIAARVYAILRNKGLFSWRMGEESRALAMASLAHEGLDEAAIAALFDGSSYGPAPLGEDERALLHAGLQKPIEDAPPHIAGEYPQWLESELTRAYGETLAGEMQSLQARASVDLRVNRLRAARGDLLVGLQSLGIGAEPTPYSPDGIRIAFAEGLGTLQHMQFFQTGAFEFQDEASQIAALLCDAKPGMRVLDLAAGAGGKTLALAAAMENSGEIVAFDEDARRFKPLGARASRAGASCIKPVESRGGAAWEGGFDRVLIDAPCSGTGTWRRQPELRWRLTPERLDELKALQDALLDEGARYTKPGGHLIYVTCSLLPCENEDRICGFLQRHSAFRIVPAQELWRGASIPGIAQFLRMSPAKTATDGFFVAIMAREMDR